MKDKKVVIMIVSLAVFSIFVAKICESTTEYDTARLSKSINELKIEMLRTSESILSLFGIID
jgi:uncharacterized membrane protein YqhA